MTTLHWTASQDPDPVPPRARTRPSRQRAAAGDANTLRDFLRKHPTEVRI